MAENKVVIERVFDAPLERVWRAWTEPEIIKQWWGPKDFTAPVAQNDFRVGGTYLYLMRGAAAPGSPEQDFWGTGTYQEIVPGEKIVATDNFADAEGNVQPPSYYGMKGDEPLNFKVTVTFAPLDSNRTKLTLVHEGMTDPKDVENMTTGWNESLDKLNASVDEEELWIK
jgi:uncharacterized protein YndB with AHSA1/START domain